MNLNINAVCIVASSTFLTHEPSLTNVYLDNCQDSKYWLCTTQTSQTISKIAVIHGKVSSIIIDCLSCTIFQIYCMYSINILNSLL